MSRYWISDVFLSRPICSVTSTRDKCSMICETDLNGSDLKLDRTSCSDAKLINYELSEKLRALSLIVTHDLRHSTDPVVATKARVEKNQKSFHSCAYLNWRHPRIHPSRSPHNE